MLDYSQLEALVAAVKHENFVAAAKSLAITQSALSQRIKALEESLGQPLLVRSSPVRPTALGQELLAHFQKVMMLESSLKNRSLPAKEGAAFHSIAIALNTESLSTWFIDAVAPTLVKESLLLELLVDDQDRTSELLRSGKVLGCISSNKTAPNGCRSHALGGMKYVLAATRAFRKRHFPDGFNEQAINTAPAAVYGQYDKIHEEFLRQHFPDFKNHKPPCFFIPSPEGLVEFTRRGLCCSLLPERAIASDLKAKHLVDLMPGKSLFMELYWHVWSHDHSHLKSLTQVIVAGMKT